MSPRSLRGYLSLFSCPLSLCLSLPCFLSRWKALLFLSLFSPASLCPGHRHPLLSSSSGGTRQSRCQRPKAATTESGREKGGGREGASSSLLPLPSPAAQQSPFSSGPLSSTCQSRSRVMLQFVTFHTLLADD